MHLVDMITNLINRAERALMRDDETYVLSNFERAVQLDDYSCGSKSSYMILRHFRRARSTAAVARLVGTDQDGTAAGPILRGFRARGLTARINAGATMSDLERAIRSERVVLVSLDGDHWGVVYGYSRSHVFLADPSLWKSIRCTLSRREFRRRWDRWAMFVGLTL